MKKLVIFLFLVIVLCGCNSSGNKTGVDNIFDDISVNLPEYVYKGQLISFENKNTDYEIFIKSDDLIENENNWIVKESVKDNITFEIEIVKDNQSKKNLYEIPYIQTIYCKKDSLNDLKFTEIFDTKSFDEEIAFFDQNQIYGVKEGNTIISFTSGNIKYAYNCIVFDEITLKEELNNIKKYIKDNSIVDNQGYVQLVDSIPNYECIIEYYPQDDTIDLKDKVEKGIYSKYIYFNCTIQYRGQIENYVFPLFVDSIGKEELKVEINEYLSDTVYDIVNNESGFLPTKYEKYNMNISWISSFPMVIKEDYSLRKAYYATDVTLVATYYIEGDDYEMKFEYKSKGISEEEKAKYIDEVFKNLIPSEADKFLATIYTKDVDIITDYIYPNSKTQLRPGNGTNGVKMNGGPQYVVIHDTGMSNIGDNADGLSKYIHSQADSSEGRVASWHFSIDDTKCYNHVPTDEIAWHAGDGSRTYGSTYYNSDYKAESIGGGNQNGIGIETCINPGNDYELTMQRTAKLTAQLLIKYNLGLDRIKQHNHFSGKNCPNIIRSTLGFWEAFLKNCEIQYFIMTIAKDVQVKWENDHPEIVKESGLIVTPVDDTKVNLTLHLNLDEKEYNYKYTTLVKGYTNDKRFLFTYTKLVSELPTVITSNISLPLNNEKYGTTIIWKSNNEDVLSSNGLYYKPSVETNVVFDVTIKFEEDEYKTRVTFKVH